MTRWINSVLVNGFGHSTGAGVTIGEHGFWFQTESPSYAHLACAAPDGLDQDFAAEFVDVYSDFQARWAAQGVPVYLIVIPKKSSVVPEYLPSFLRERCEGRPNPTEQIVDRLRARGAAVAYDLEWFRDQGVDRMFDRRSYHWDDGAGVRYFNYLFSDGLLSDTEIEPTPIGDDGRIWIDHVDLANKLGIGPLDYEMRRPRVRDRLRGNFDLNEWLAETGEDYTSHFDRRSFRSARFMRGRVGTGRALYFGDSFSKRPDNYFGLQMEESLILWTRNMRSDLRMDSLIQDFHPDFVVLVFVESKVAVVLPEDPQSVWSAFLPAGTEWPDSSGD